MAIPYEHVSYRRCTRTTESSDQFTIRVSKGEIAEWLRLFKFTMVCNSEHKRPAVSVDHLEYAIGRVICHSTSYVSRLRKSSVGQG